ncbi:MAG TPA: pitrilysin family protein [Steroidobacteraceae bacterium]|nr:pitrilysin family protein [Steroidobacteraceae bacterium]
MIRHNVLKGWIFPLLLCVSTGAGANMAEQSHRAQAASIDVVTYPTGVKDVVVILGVLPAGDAMAEPGNIAIPTLAGMMLDRGTKALDKFAIADQLDNVGAEIAFAVGVQSLEIRAKCLKKDLPLVMRLIAADLRTPALQSQEFAKAKQQFIGSLEASLQNTEGRAHEAFGRTVFPAGHPNRPHTIAEYIAAAKSATLDDLKAFHAKYYGPAHMTLVLVGDVSAEGAQAEVTKVFSGWSGGHDYIRPAQPAAASGPQDVAVPLNDKPSVSMILGQATGLRYKDPDALALRVGTAILGHGFTGRLMGTVRDKEGLTYNIGAGVAEDSVADGAWDISASFAPALLDKGIASTRRELQKWWSEGVTDSELADRKQGMIGGYFVGLSTTGGLANTIVTSNQRGYDLTWLDGYPEAVKALTRVQVNNAIKTHLDPASMVLVEAGSVKAASVPPPSRN